MRLAALLLATLSLLAATAAPAAAEVPDNATWTETWFESFDGTRLHADVLRPKGLPADAKTPVLLTVSPYTNHLAEATSVKPQGGPSNRFYDFLTASALLDRGYTYVIVDLRGFGGSDGCNDWGGPGERGDVKAAVEWAASQPWSTGRVGLFGKSYDAWTGLMGVVEQAEGLDAVIAMEPVYSAYRYGYSNRVRFTNSVLTPSLFTVIDATPGHPADQPEYHLRATPKNPACYALNIGLQQQEDEDSAFWQARDLVDAVKAVKKPAPVFLMQGFLETNTKPERAFEFWNALRGDEHRAWFGQFSHVRGYEMEGDRFATGRTTFVAEAARFLDEHLKGVKPAVQDPKVEVQDQRGRWRAEAAWPPADTRAATFPTYRGTYRDDGRNRSSGSNAGQGTWTFSQELPWAVHLAGPGTMQVEIASAVPRSNLVANVYDVAPDGTARLVSRGAYLLDGPGRVTFEMYGQDWVFAEGHRIGILLSGANSDWYAHVPTGQQVRVAAATFTAPFKTRRVRKLLSGGSTPRLEDHMADTATVPQATIARNWRHFTLPPRLR